MKQLKHLDAPKKPYVLVQSIPSGTSIDVTSTP
jgi:hypothetical protein